MNPKPEVNNYGLPGRNEPRRTLIPHSIHPLFTRATPQKKGNGKGGEEWEDIHLSPVWMSVLFQILARNFVRERLVGLRNELHKVLVGLCNKTGVPSAVRHQHRIGSSGHVAIMHRNRTMLERSCTKTGLWVAVVDCNRITQRFHACNLE